MAEEEKTRHEKEQRRREKNRRKRDAYRTRKREKQWNSSWAYETKSRTGYEKSSKKSREKNAGKKSKGEQKKSKNDKSTSPSRFEWSTRDSLNEERWEKKMSKAFKTGSFESMKKLFTASFKQALSLAYRNDLERAIKRSYRTHSIRFHPDKNKGSASGDEKSHLFTIAFQALNDAHELVLESVLHR